MKVLVVIASIIVLSKALDKGFKEKLMEKVQEIGSKCIEEVHATDEDVAELLAYKIPPTTHEAKCLIFCMHKGFNMIDKDGNIDKKGTLQALEKVKQADADLYDKSIKIVDICFKSIEKDDDPCITSTKYAECGLREAKAMGISESLFEI